MTATEPRNEEATGDVHDESTVLYAGPPPAEGPTPSALEARLSMSVRHEEDFLAVVDRVSDNVAGIVAVYESGGFDGLALLERVRRQDAALPFVLVPREVDEGVARAAVDADVTAFVPSNDDDATTAVIEAIENHVRGRTVTGMRMPISDLAIAEERRLKERALDEAPIGITISDATRPDNPIIYVNESFEDITGYGPQEAMGVNHRILQGPDTDPERVSRLRESVTNEENARVVLKNYTRSSEPFWNQVDIAPIVDEDGELTHYVGFQMDVTERVRAQKQLRAERSSLDRLLDRINGLLNDVTEGLVRADSRTRIEEVVAERVGDVSEYRDAWVGRYHPGESMVTVEAVSTSSEPTPTRIDLAEDTRASRDLAATVEEQRARTVEDGSFPLAGGEITVLIPLTYRSTTYGVLGVVLEEDTVDERERVLLRSIGRTVGTTINDVLTKRTMTGDTRLRIALRISGPFLLRRLAADLGCTLTQEATITENEETTVLATVEGASGDEVLERARSDGRVHSAEVLVEDRDAPLVQIRTANIALFDVLADQGGTLVDLSITPNGVRIEFETGTERTARRAIDDLQSAYEEVSLEAYHEVSDPSQTAAGFREEMRERLTDRQLTALKKAYVGGFFEWPREIEGDQLADSMDIVPSTYHQHLQAAKQKLVSAFFEGR